MDMRGHNSKASDKTLAELAELSGDVNGKPPKKRFPYFKFYPRDWIAATRGMTLEERGAYIDFICFFMESEGDLQDDDDWIRHQMHVPRQRWKKMKKSLIDHGKISVQGGRLVNERCLRELDELMAKSTQNSQNIQKRWKKVGEKFEQSSNKVETFSEEKSKKPNEINEPRDTNVFRHARVTTDTDTDLERKKEIRPKGLLSDLPSDAPPKNRRARSKNSYTTQFEEFWKIYPRKEAKGDAFRAWKKLTIEEQRKAWAACKQQIQNLTDRMRDPAGNFCPMPATWLNGGRFDDEVSNRKLTNARYGAVKDPTEHCL